MNIRINFIPHNQQRYETLGDWFFDENGDLIISVSNNVPELPTKNHQILCAMHELSEVVLCEQNGVKQEDVDKFDMETFPAFNLPEDYEPGDHPEAPYGKEHRQAMLIEMLMANFLGMKNYGTCK